MEQCITKTIKELLLSKDADNNIIASEILKTCPTIIDTTFFSSESTKTCRGDGGIENITNINYNDISRYYLISRAVKIGGNGEAHYRKERYIYFDSLSSLPSKRLNTSNKLVQS